MTRSLFRKAGNPSRSEYRKSVAIKLAAFALALGIFLPLTALLSRPKAIKDLSDGTLPFTFTTRDKSLQRELAALNAANALPNQRASTQSQASKRLVASLYEALSGPEIQRLKTTCDQFEANLEAFASETDADTTQNSFQTTLDFIGQSEGQFDQAFDLRPIQGALWQELSEAEACQQPVSMKGLSNGNEASPLPGLQRILGAKLAVHLACGEQQAALKTCALMLKLANSVLNSTEPDIFFLRDTLQRVSHTLATKCWSSDSLRDLEAMLHRQRARQNVQKALLAYEREKALLAFERVRQTGLRSLSGAAPGVNILADSLRELKPDGTVKAAKEVWNGIRYDADFDELVSLRLLGRLAGPGFMPYFKAVQHLEAKKGDGPVTERIKASLRMELRKESESLALLESMDMALKLRLGMDFDKTKASPLDGQPYRPLKAPGKIKILYGDAEGDAFVIDSGN